MAKHPLLTTATALLLTALAAGPAWAWSDDAERCAEAATSPGADATRGVDDEAIAACTRALRSADLTPAERARTLNNRGIVYELGGAYDRAFADYLDAVGLYDHGVADGLANGTSDERASVYRGMDGAYDPAFAGRVQTIDFNPVKAIGRSFNSIKKHVGDCSRHRGRRRLLP